jgi:hypothetical protein
MEDLTGVDPLLNDRVSDPTPREQRQRDSADTLEARQDQVGPAFQLSRRLAHPV